MMRDMVRSSSRLLIDEYPLQVLPSLAVAIGLNEAIFLQQLHFWLQRREHVFDDQPWTYDTLDQWHEQFPFWGIRTIRRVIEGLVQRDLIKRTSQHNRVPTDRTMWYTIDYERLTELEGAIIPLRAHAASPAVAPCGQNGHMHLSEPANGCGQNGHMHVANLATSLSEISSEPQERDLLTTFVDPAVNGNAVPFTAPDAGAHNGQHAAKKAKKVPTPLAPDDWIWKELLNYREEFDIDALNDDEWWLNLVNSFPDFSPKWVPLAFASLARWFQENPKRRPRVAHRWKWRMGFSLNWYYDKHLRREGYGKPAKTQTRY